MQVNLDKIKIVFTLFLLLFFTVLLSSCMGKSKILSCSIKFSYDNAGRFIVYFGSDSSYFLLDTGTATSCILSDRLEISAHLKYFLLVNGKQLVSVRKVDSINLGGIKLKNMNFAFMKSSSTNFRDSTKALGIIGMDILSHKYCFFDIKKRSLNLADAKKHNLTPDLVLPYRTCIFNDKPFVSFLLDGKFVDNVLFDTGYNCFLQVRKNDLTVNDSLLENGTVIDFLGRKDSIQHVAVDSLSINHLIFNHPNVLIYNGKKILGMQFVSCFSSFLIDPFTQTIEFYI